MKPQDALTAVERLEAELTAVKYHMAETESELFAAIAETKSGAGDTVLFRGPMKPDSIRRLADAVAQRCGGLAAVFAGEGSQFNYALIRADGTDISAAVKAMNTALQGRGGGRSGFAQGSIQADRVAIEAFFNT